MPEPAAAPPATPSTPPATPWHAGIESEIIGHWQAKGWPIDDPKSIAIAATQAYKGVEKLVGVNPEDRIVFPKPSSDKATWDAFYSRLGAPNDPKEYDFSAVKHVDDKPPLPALVDAVRNVAGQLRLPKDRAPDLMKAVVKTLDDIEAGKLATAKTALDEEKATLNKSWGLNKEINRLEALKGATKLGFTADDVNKLENAVGYAKTMEALRRVGETGREAPYVEGGTVNGRPPTADAAKAKLESLEKDEGFRKRFLAGDTQAIAEMRQLNAQIHGYDAAALAAA
jgi:hypothetical protein